jgi:glucose-1-phosphate cytidylyltransferase
LPKTLVEIHGRPLLWYVFIRLYMAGYRHFILPLGYRGHLIQGFIDRTLTNFEARIDAIPTGEDTEVAQRLHRVSHLLPRTSFLLINGDTLFDFNVGAVASDHDVSGVDVTLMSCAAISQFGLLVLDGGRVIDFTRDSLVESYRLQHGGRLRRAYVNSGIAVISTAALLQMDLAKAENFEVEFYSSVIDCGTVRHQAIDGYWFAIDTPKDVEIANAGKVGNPLSDGALELFEKLTIAETAILRPA